MKLALGLSILLCLAGFGPAAATSYVQVSDETLADQSEAIVAGTVLAQRPGAGDASISTEYLVQADEVVKGTLSDAAIVVRVPGGLRPDGVGLKVWGAPSFREGEEVLLFLDGSADGSYQVLHLMLGAFHRGELENSHLALRDLSEAAEVADGREHAAEGPRHFAGFVRWLADRASGEIRQPDYRLPIDPEDLHAATEAYSLTAGADRVPSRWFLFDGGRNAAWRVHTAGQPGLSSAEAAERLKVALNEWNDDGASAIRYTFGGTTGTSKGLQGSDGINGVLFNDPGNRHVPGSYACGSGGVVAIGAAYYKSSTRSYRSMGFHEIIEADIVTNDGSDCYFSGNPRGAEEVFAHELGHTLGFGHSDVADAAMWPKTHNGGRGARLHDDDRKMANLVYGDGNYQPAPQPDPPSGPSAPQPPAASGATLSVSTVGTTEIGLAWSCDLGNVASYRVEIQNGKKFREVLRLPGSARTALLQRLVRNRGYNIRLRVIRQTGAAVFSNLVQVRTQK